ncbi:cilia- and flagella-associated protein 77-like [Elgaria multicarinata webbii]|uniref:cilia- and flagella-associated protein 77-like n=1 Tax=Elgaria multicarinata webbii TaxID=159646 RepID=UPI002FCCE2F8
MDSFVQKYLKCKRRATVSNICPPPLLPLTKADILPGSENHRVGLVRDSMFQNHLILKSELGRTCRRCTKIPGTDFVYGLTLRGTDGGVPEAIGHWQVMPHKTIKPKKVPKDFITMNYKGIKAGLFTAREHYLYRQHHDVRCKGAEGDRFPKDPPRLPDAMTYGKPYHPSTPITDILQHKFRDLWLQEQQKSNIYLKEKHQQKRRGKMYETRTVQLRKHQIPVKPDSLWHMPQFKNIAPHLVTFPTLEDRANAFKAQRIEAPVRRGHLAQGIYTHG